MPDITLRIIAFFFASSLMFLLFAALAQEKPESLGRR